jgi:hypothetical protein
MQRGVGSENFARVRGWCAAGALAKKSAFLLNFRPLERVRGCFHQRWKSGKIDEKGNRENTRNIFETAIVGSGEFTLSPSQATRKSNAARAYCAPVQGGPHPLAWAHGDEWGEVDPDKSRCPCRPREIHQGRLMVLRAPTWAAGNPFRKLHNLIWTTGFSATRAIARFIPRPAKDLGAFAS